jgi:hypothetical protein
MKMKDCLQCEYWENDLDDFPCYDCCACDRFVARVAAQELQVNVEIKSKWPSALFWIPYCLIIIYILIQIWRTL